jgi:Uncharacterized protein conserved in bacteria (DUF2147)
MKRCCVFLLMLLSSSAYAGESYSFVVAGHRIHLEAPRGCNSTSCVSVSIPGIYETRRKRDRDDDAAPQAAPAKPPAPAPEPVSIRPSVPPAGTASTVAVLSAPPAAAVKPVVCPTPDTSAPRPAAVQPPVAAPVAPAAATPPAQDSPPKISKVSHRADDEPAETPLGDWQTEGRKGSVRIEQCGRALCGYVLDPASNAAGEAVLINMRRKAPSEWSGNIYSVDSKDTYFATVAMQGPNSLRVEACALGHFFCAGNVWSRIGGTPQRLITSRQIPEEPRS